MPDKVSLLIVEDDPHIRYLLQAAAERCGAYGPIDVAADGEAAWERLHVVEVAALPTLIVTDLSMPRMTGLELLRALKHAATLSAIPVAVITSSDVPNDRELALAAGACAFLPKPQGLEAMTQMLVNLRDACARTTQSATTIA